MKKRILCMLLALILVAGLVPVASISASAATTAISEKAITVLKQLHPYTKECKASGSRYYIGYGTLCTDKDHDKLGNTKTHTIKEVDADKALREELKAVSSEVASFASKSGLNLNQAQFDALAILSFRNGTAWMKGTGVFKTAITTKGNSTNKLLNAFINVSGDYGKQLANMYLHGSYSNEAPSYFKQVTFNATGGYLAEGMGETYKPYYDTTAEDYDLPVPTMKNATFKGWYTEATGGERIIVLDRFTASKSADKLYAVWQTKDSTDVSYKVATNRISPWMIYKSDLKTEAEDWTVLQDKDGKVLTNIDVDKDYLGSDGYLWVRIAGTETWVRLSKSGEAGASPVIDVTVTVTNSYVNMRSKGSIYATKSGSFQKGDKLRIVATKDSYESILWGAVAKSASDDTIIGWVALSYTDWNTVKANSQSIKTDVPANALARAVIQCANYVNVRSNPGTAGTKVIGALANQDRVYIYEFKTVNGFQWGRTDAGWFSLNYAQVTMLNDNTVISTDSSIANYAYSATAPAGTKVYQYADSDSNVVRTMDKATNVTVMKLKADNAKGVWGKPDWGYIGDGWIIWADITNESTSKFLVKKEITTVRTWEGESQKIEDKLSSGVELLIDNGTLSLSWDGDKTTVWGWTEKYNGYVNLSSDQVSRTNAPELKDDKTTPASYEIGTVKGTDAVNVREKASLYCRVVGKLSRGTEVRILGWSDNGKWAKVDTDLENRGKENWISKDYLDVRVGTLDKNQNSSSGSSNSTAKENAGGSGIVANTYSGVNLRSTPSSSGTFLGKILPGTPVTLDEIKTVGSGKWGHVVDKGWVSMQYIAMMTYDEIPGANSNLPEGAITGNSYDEFQSSSTTAIYTGYANGEVIVRKSPEDDAEQVGTLKWGDSITLHELLKVTVTKEQEADAEDLREDDGEKYDSNTVTTTTTTTYWARINGGYIRDPQTSIYLNPLHEETYTVTGAEKVKVYKWTDGNELMFEAVKGEKLTVTGLEIVKDKVWGHVENTDEEDGWVCLDALSEGAIYVNPPANNNNATQPTEPVLGSTGNTGEGGIVTNTSGYKYTGKVIRTDALKVRNTASLNAPVTTTLKGGKALVIYETTIAEDRAWGRCDAGWVYLYYVDLTPCDGTAVDARVVYNDNTVAYTDSSCTTAAGTYAKMAVVDIYEVVGKMARTELGWVNTDNFL